MKTFLSRFPRPGKALAAALALAMFPPLLPAGTSRAAGLAEDHTVLYYLVEMQRRFKKNCGGTPMPEAPSLNPSAALRGLAERSASSGQSPADFASANGMAGIPLLAVRVQAQSPQEAFDRVNAAQCPNLMKSDYRYVGAAKSGDQWTLFLAGAEPGALPGDPPTPGGVSVPAGPTAPGAMGAPVEPGMAAAPGAASGGGFAPQQPVPPTQPYAPEGAAGISPSVTTQDAGGGFAPGVSSPPAGVATPPPGGFRDAYDPHPAAPAPTDIVPTDGAGRPLSNPVPIDPSFGAPSQPAPPVSGAQPYQPAPPALAEPYQPAPPASETRPYPPAEAVPSQPAASGGVLAGPSSPPPGGFRDAYDPHPAAPVPTAVVPTDGAGRPLGKPVPIDSSAGAAHRPTPPASGTRPYRPVAPSGRSAPPASPSGIPAAPIYVPPGGAGPVNDPYAPAAPVVTQEFAVDPTGRIIGPVRPGAPAPGAPASPKSGAPLPYVPPPATR